MMGLEIWRTSLDLGRWSDQWDAFVDATVGHACLRSPWLLAWLPHHLDHRPFIPVLRGPDGLRAAAPLAVTRTATGIEIVALGHGTSDLFSVPARSPDDARALMDGITAHLGGLPGGWHLHLRQLRADDWALPHMRTKLPHASTSTGLPNPTTRFHPSRHLRDHASSNYRGQARHKWNRLVRDQHQPDIRLHRTWPEIRQVLPEVVAVCRQRDEEIAGRSRLNSRDYRDYFREVMHRHSCAGRLELAILRASGRIAAYSIALEDAAAYRQWNKHHNSDFAAYRPGQVLDAWLLERALDDERFDEFDWMAGDEHYKKRTANDTVRTVDLVAGTGSGLLPLAPRVAKHWVRAQAAERPQVRAVVDRAKHIERLVHRGWRGQ